MLLQQPQHLTIGVHCARRAQGARENMACAFVTGLHRVTLQWLYSIASMAPPSPPTTYCFSTYPAVNANYRNPFLCCACAPYISSIFAGIYNLDLCLSACCTQPLPDHSHFLEPKVSQHQKADQWPPPPFGGISVLLNGDLFQLTPPHREMRHPTRKSPRRPKVLDRRLWTIPCSSPSSP